MLKSSLCGYSDAYIRLTGAIIIISVERPLPPGSLARTPQQILQSTRNNERNG